MNSVALRDHGGGLDDAIGRYGGARADWIDLSTGISPRPWPVPQMPPEVWTSLPDRDAQAGLERAARAAWRVPADAAILAAPGTSSLIARIPALAPAGRVHIPGPTYNEHGAAFAAAGWMATGSPHDADAAVAVHPNNPDGHLWPAPLGAPLSIVDESFCDLVPDVSLVAHAARPGTVILKSFGKFWGLAGLRLGFAIGAPDLIAVLAQMLGPWPVSGPALHMGARALTDTGWAADMRRRHAKDAARLDRAMARTDPSPHGTDLFRLYGVGDAARWHDALARRRILTRRFPWSTTALRLGLPPPGSWDRVEAALSQVAASVPVR